MIERLLRLIDEVVQLLLDCGWQQQAEWFRAKRRVLGASQPESPEFKRELGDLDKGLAGMGSFSDIPLSPKPGSLLNEQEATEKQWALTSRLGDAIDELRKTR